MLAAALIHDTAPALGARSHEPLRGAAAGEEGKPGGEVAGGGAGGAGDPAGGVAAPKAYA